MMNHECIKCGDLYNPKRAELGYRTCLVCGGIAAEKEAHRKSKCIAPAYNKGAYQYVGTIADAKGIGR